MSALPYTPAPHLSSYDEDVWRHAHEEEGRIVSAPGYGAWGDRPGLNLRVLIILIEWLCEVHLKFRSSEYTIHLAVAMLHRFIAVQNVTRAELQLLGCAAYWMASKMEEEWPIEPRDMVYIANRSFTREKICDMEMRLGGALDFRLHSPTAIHFLYHFVEVAAPPGCDTKRVLKMAELCLLLCLFGRTTYSMLPSLQAVACLSIALYSEGHGVCTGDLVAVSPHSEASIAAATAAIQARLCDARKREAWGRDGCGTCNILKVFRGRNKVGLEDIKCDT